MSDRLRVLVVRDGEDLATIVADVLRDEGHEVFVVAHDHAIACSTSFAPRIVVIDLGPPGSRRITLARELRRSLPPGALFVGLSTEPRGDVLVTHPGAVDRVLRLPFDIDELVAAIAP